MTTPTPHGALELLLCPSELLQAAANYLENYADFIRRTCPINLEEHPYVPDLDAAIDDLRAAIQQAAGAVPEDMSCPGCLVGTLQRRLLKSKNRVLAAKVCDNCKIELFGQEQSEYNKNSRDVSTPSPLGREAGSSDHLVPCAGDRVQVPLSDANLAKRAKIGAMLTDDNGKISMYPAEYRRILEGRYIRAFRDAEAAHGITAPAPRPDAPTSQMKNAPVDQSGYHDPARIAAWNAANPDSVTAPREDGHE